MKARYICIVISSILIKSQCLQKGQPNVCQGIKKSTGIHGGIVEVIHWFCCSGFKEENNKCIECVECVKEESCPGGFCGKRCTRRCSDCPSWTFCHPEQCCMCPTGFTGQYCNQTCDNGYFGLNCTQPCKCSEHSTCDRVSGKCTCDPGWIGQRCEETCENGYFGVNCSQPCQCMEHSSCDRVSGKCTCDSGWSGQYCDKIDFNDNFCLTNCECSDSKCDPSTGECHCPSENSTIYTVSTPLGGLSNSNNVFIYTISVIVVLALVSLLCVGISVFNIVKKSRNVYFHTDQGDTVLSGGYDEINPYAEISPDDLVELRHPYYSSPAEVEVRKARSLPFIIPPDNCQVIHNDREDEIPKYLSLPNLSEYNDVLNPYSSLRRPKDKRHYDYLKLKSEKTEICSKFHPYSALMNDDSCFIPCSSIEARHTGNNKPSFQMLDRPGDNSYLTVIYKSSQNSILDIKTE